MANQELLPKNDQDLLLAQQLGEVLERNGSFTELDDPIIEPLNSYKQDLLSSYRISSTVSNSIWDSIAKETTKKKANVTPLFSRPSTIAWASAAAILIAAFIGFFWLNTPSDIQLVAESGSSIETVILDDGSEVTLRPNSQLFEVHTENNERAYSLSGEAFFDVATNPDAPFKVDAEYGTITVLGTRFNVSNWGGKALVYLEEGSVKVSTPNADSSLTLAPGESSEIQNGTISLTNSLQADKFTDWISNSIVFYGNSPEEVVAELNQHYGVSITIEKLENRSGLNGTLQLESISQTLDDLGLVLGGTFRQRSLTEYEYIPME